MNPLDYYWLSASVVIVSSIGYFIFCMFEKEKFGILQLILFLIFAFAPAINIFMAVFLGFFLAVFIIIFGWDYLSDLELDFASLARKCANNIKDNVGGNRYD